MCKYCNNELSIISYRWDDDLIVIRCYCKECMTIDEIIVDNDEDILNILLNNKRYEF